MKFDIIKTKNVKENIKERKEGRKEENRKEGGRVEEIWKKENT